MTRYTIGGRKATKAKCAAHVAAQVELENNHAEMAGMFDKAHEQSTDGYIAREYVECYGVTIRHDGEE